jgi:hypothetical protein
MHAQSIGATGSASGAGKRILRTLSFLLLALIAASPFAFAQIGGGGSIQGSVLDPTGAVVSKATVTATNIASGQSYTRLSSERGVYVITPLIPGTYRVQVDATGFAGYTQEHVTVDAMQITTVNVSLSIGSASITITVEPPPVNATNAVVGDVVRNDDYANLPLNMSGGPRCSTCLIAYSAGEGNGYNGGTSYHNEIYIDGMVGTTINMQGNGNEVGTSLPVEAVQQGEVQTVGTSAQFQGQGVANFTTQSGGDHYHGSLFEYFRNTSLDTWNFTSKQTINAVTKTALKPVEHQNEFGGSLGGPIKRNKAYFFVTLERMIYSATPNPSLITIPTTAMRTGDFSAFGRNIYDPTTTTCKGTTCTRSQFQYNGQLNVISPSRISSVSKYLQQWLPTPTNSNQTLNYAGGFTSGFTYFKNFDKLDYNLTPSQHIVLTYGTGNRAPNPLDSTNMPLPYTTSTATVTYDNLAMITHTWTINSHTVNDFKYGFARYETCSKDPAEGKAEWAASAAGLSNYGVGHASNAFPNVGFSGTNAPYGWDTSNKPQCVDANTYNVQDALQTTRGAHSITIGGQYEWYQYNGDSGPTTGTNASWAFSNTQTANFSSGSTVNTATGAAYASYLTGYTSSYYNSRQVGFKVIGGRFKAFSPYIQDDWKITPKLTLNLGLRWDLYSPWHEVKSRGSYLDISATNPITGTLGALTYYGDGPYSCHCSKIVDFYLGNIGPRFGFAYSVSPKTVVRGSYGLSYTHGGGTGGRGGAWAGTAVFGLGATRTISAVDGYSPADPLNGTSISNTWDTAIADLADTTQYSGWGTGYTTVTGYTGSGQALYYGDPYYAKRSPVYANWSFGIQQALTSTTTLTVDYAASMGQFLPGEQNRPQFAQQIDPKYLALGSLLAAKTTDTNIAAANKILPVARPFATYTTSSTIMQMLSPYPQYAGITDIWGNRAHSRYDAIEIGIKQNKYKGLTLSMNYTYSKLMDNENSGTTAYSTAELWQKNTQSPSKLNLYGTWQEPFGHTSHRLLNTAMKDWVISGIYTYSGSGPLGWGATGCSTQYTGSCLPNLDSSRSAKNVRINGKWGKGITGSNFAIKYLDSTAFSVPANYTLGQVFRNAYKITGPSSSDIDLTVKRKFPIHNNYKFSIEASAFNLTNHVEFGGLSTTVGASAFGQFTKQSNSARDIQLAARIDF